MKIEYKNKTYKVLTKYIEDWDKTIIELYNSVEDTFYLYYYGEEIYDLKDYIEFHLKDRK